MKGGNRKECNDEILRNARMLGTEDERLIPSLQEVTSTIWKTLYDFPSLKTCTNFNRFVLECVDVSWDIVAGIDGRFPR